MGNFDGDTSGELILRKGGTGADAGALFIAKFAGGTVLPVTRVQDGLGSIQAPVPSGTKIEGVADTDGDGVDDLILRGNNSIDRWKIGALAVQSKGTIYAGTGSYWQIAGFPDFDGDRKRGILFRGNAGETWSWDLNGNTIVRSGPLNSVDPNWKITKKQN